MDIQISTTELRAALARVQGVVADKKGTMPILSSVLMEATITPEGGRLTVRAYDLEIGLCSQHACEVKKEGAVALPAKALFEIAKALPESSARIKTGANNRMELSSGAASFKLAGMSAEEFPAMPTPDNMTYETVEREGLCEGIKRVAFAMSSDETRYALNGVYMEATPCGVNLVATDGHRLALCRLDNDKRYGLCTDKGAIVPRKAVNELRKLLSEETAAPAELAFNENTVAYRRAGLTYMARLVDGQFPNYSQVIPEESKTPAHVSRAALSEVLKRVLLLAGDSIQTVLFSLDEGNLVLSSKDVNLGEATDSLNVKFPGGAVKLGLNGRYVMEALSALDQDGLILSVHSEMDPVVLRPAGSDNLTYVLMPVRL